MSGIASPQNLLASGAQAACSSGVPWKLKSPPVGGFAGCFSSTAGAVPPEVSIRTRAVQILAFIVLCLNFVHALLTTTARSPRSKELEAAGGCNWIGARRLPSS